MNGTHAALEGMHREEALARFARYDAPLPYTELDVIRWVVFLLGEAPLQVLLARFLACSCFSLPPPSMEEGRLPCER